MRQKEGPITREVRKECDSFGIDHEIHPEDMSSSTP